MKALSLDEYKRLLLVMLKDIDVFCKENNIQYYLDSGTLLGAVRHKGFIPWDDDIDLVMPRNDYEHFILCFDTENCSILSHKTRKDYFYPYAKVNFKNSTVKEVELPEIEGLGVNIDVFPLDGMPDNLILRRIHQDTLMFLNKTRALSVRLKRKVPSFFKPVFRWKCLVALLDHLAKKYDMHKTQYCGNIVATTVRHKEIPIQCFDGTDYLPFEDDSFPVPTGYDAYLTELYGDYMKLPPKEQQVTRHHIEAFMCE